ISGRLNRKTGGPGFRPPLPQEVTVTLLKNQWPVTKDAKEHRRRSVYLFARRNLRFPMFAVFDRPDALASCARRDRSTTAIQSLTLFNSDFSFECAHALAKTLINKEDRIEGAYESILGRAPSKVERDTISEFLSVAKAKGTSSQEATTDLCLSLFNLNEFIYVN
ncbi:DUF1553 domain-containing protein, partial [Verrucomicrobia bacterium]|nr:DUF1553 domain-containing protein [Verrucomicrobiota bacterium]